jgi:hypothetical protein
MRTILLGIAPLVIISCATGAPRPTSTAGVANRQAPDTLETSTDETSTTETSTDTGPLDDPRTTQAAEALAAGDDRRVLTLTQEESNAHNGPWLDYDRAAALAHLGRTDEAVALFKKTEGRFDREGDQVGHLGRVGASFAVGDRAGHADSVWGRAHALSEAGRCREARSAYAEYGAFMGPSDRLANDMATTYAASCKPLVVLH